MFQRFTCCNKGKRSTRRRHLWKREKKVQSSTRQLFLTYPVIFYRFRIIFNYQICQVLWERHANFFNLISEHTDKANCSGSKQWTGCKFEAVLRRTRYRGTYVSRTSIRPLETNVGCSKTPCRHVASAQKMKGSRRMLAKRIYNRTKICTDLKYTGRTVGLRRHDVVASHPDIRPSFQPFTFKKH